MITPRILVVALGAGFFSMAFADGGYSLARCGQFKGGVSVEFVGTRGEKRSMYLSARGLELSGNVKGSARLSQVTKVVLQPALEITYTSGTVVRFGPIDASCQRIFREAGDSLVQIHDNG
jgi:hypothetical protein